MSSIGFIGFGEAARAIVSGWKHEGLAVDLAAYDIKSEEWLASVDIRNACHTAGVAHASHIREVMSVCGTIFSLVTADNALAAATNAARHIQPGTLYLDCNSCSPGTKQQAAGIIEAAGGRYVDVAIMSPIYPARHRSPFLFSGADASLAESTLSSLHLNARTVGDKVGQASSIKMLRSVIIKGIEALMAECFLAARKAGVQAEVIGSLQHSDPGIDWERRASYSMERMIVHGQRRAAEMVEVAKTLSELGLPTEMSSACGVWQQRIGSLDLLPGNDELSARCDIILPEVRAPST